MEVLLSYEVDPRCGRPSFEIRVILPGASTILTLTVEETQKLYNYIDSVMPKLNEYSEKWDARVPPEYLYRQITPAIK